MVLNRFGHSFASAIGPTRSACLRTPRTGLIVQRDHRGVAAHIGLLEGARLVDGHWRRWPPQTLLDDILLALLAVSLRLDLRFHRERLILSRAVLVSRALLIA